MHTALFFSCLAAVAAAPMDELDSFIQGQIDSAKIPGLAAAVLKGDQVVWSREFGSADPANNAAAKVNDRSIFEVASVSKTISGLAAYVLSDMGYLNIEDRADKYIDGLNVTHPKFPDADITIHQPV